MNLMQYFRKQIDVLIANVPVGQIPVTVGNKLVQVSCHTRVVVALLRFADGHAWRFIHQ